MKNEQFNFFTHKIANPAGNTIKWDEYLQKQADGVAKAEEEESGQVLNNDGTVVNDPNKDPKSGKIENNTKESASKCDKCKCDLCECDKKKAKDMDKEAGKETGECNDAGKVKEDCGTASSTDPVVEQKINSEPNHQKGESVNGKKEEPKKEAKNTKAKITKAAGSNKFQKVASMNRKEKVNLMGYLMASKKYPLAYIEALVSEKYANLTDEEKSFIKDYWSILEPDRYAEEMVEDR